MPNQPIYQQLRAVLVDYLRARVPAVLAGYGRRSLNPANINDRGGVPAADSVFVAYTGTERGDQSPHSVDIIMPFAAEIVCLGGTDAERIDGCADIEWAIDAAIAADMHLGQPDVVQSAFLGRSVLSQAEEGLITVIELPIRIQTQARRSA